jgi:hypothetical protein
VRIRCRGNVFTDPLPRNGLHNTVVYSSISQQRLYTLQYKSKLYKFTQKKISNDCTRNTVKEDRNRRNKNEWNRGRYKEHKSTYVGSNLGISTNDVNTDKEQIHVADFSPQTYEQKAVLGKEDLKLIYFLHFNSYIPTFYNNFIKVPINQHGLITEILQVSFSQQKKRKSNLQEPLCK